MDRPGHYRGPEARKPRSFREKDHRGSLPAIIHAVNSKRSLLGLTLTELRTVMADLDPPPFRARQVYDAIYRRRVYRFEEMTDLPGSLRTALADEFVVHTLQPVEVYQSSDGTRRYLLDCEGQERIESVWIPEDKRDTICISTQAGCPLACTFCVTGVIGLRKNLPPGEIIGQVGLVLNHVYGSNESCERGFNIVLMGMGEPLANYEPVIQAIRLLVDPQGMNVSQRRITVSTAGVVPRIRELGGEAIRPELAISLSAPRDSLRDRLMPINRRWPIRELLSACRSYPLRPRERITFEYVMLNGVNDSDREAIELAQLLRGLRSKVNLIPHNCSPELAYEPSPDERILGFQRILRAHGILAFIRTPRGRDISAACGQLAARTQSSQRMVEAGR